MRIFMCAILGGLHTVPSRRGAFAAHGHASDSASA
jgi:hypothetical protein